MNGLPDVIALIMLLSLVIYVVLGGADFGGGLWDLLARGPRAEAQRRLIDQAIAPVWEANHVWLILVVVLLFSGFPRAFAVAATALHVPLSLMLLGIVLRGSAFTFRHYGQGAGARSWGRVFAGASVFTPIFLGMTLGAVSAGEIRVRGGLVEGGSSVYWAPWIGWFPLSVGLLALALFAFLAAVYLCCEAGEAALQDDFRPPRARRGGGRGPGGAPRRSLGGGGGGALQGRALPCLVELAAAARHRRGGHRCAGGALLAALPARAGVRHRSGHAHRDVAGGWRSGPISSPRMSRSPARPRPRSRCAYSSARSCSARSCSCRRSSCCSACSSSDEAATRALRSLRRLAGPRARRRSRACAGGTRAG